MALTRKRALWVDTESTYGSDPDSDGSDYKAIPAFEIGDLADGKATIATDYMTGRPYPTAPIAGPDGGSFTFSTPVIGLSSAAGDGTNASSVAADWFDELLAHVFGAVDTTEGEGLATVPDSSGFTVDAGDPYDIQDLVAIHEASIPSATAERTQWALISADNGSQDYDIAPDYATDPTASAIAYGVKQYRETGASTSTLAFIYLQDDQEYTLLGCRITSFRITGETGGIMRAEFTVEFDNKATSSKASRPDEASAPATTPITCLLSPAWVNGTKYCTRRIEIDFGIEAAVQACSEATNGRSGHDVIRMVPRVTLEPLFSTTLEDLRRNATAGRVLVQLGAGALSGGVLNTCAVHFEQANMLEESRADENGRQRMSVTLQATDKVYFSGSTNAIFAAFARA